MRRRKYGFCAKGGHPKELDQHIVCEEHRHTRGWFTACAGCGKRWDPAYQDADRSIAQGETREYVCWDCLVHKPLLVYQRPVG